MTSRIWRHHKPLFPSLGDVAIALVDDQGKDVPCSTVDNKDGTFTIEYEPKTPGTYVVQVYFAGKEVPQSPIKVKVESSVDLSKVTVRGLETRKFEDDFIIKYLYIDPMFKRYYCHLLCSFHVDKISQYSLVVAMYF